MSKKIILMTDYGCDPLWWKEPDIVGDIEPESLPLSENTIARLHQWASQYDARLDWDDPGNSPIPSPEELAQFEAEGLNLWQQLREELAPDYEVLYFSDQFQKLIHHPLKYQKVT
jgi:broad specificity phosphatase PhoE